MTEPNDRPPCVAAGCTRPQAPGILLCVRDQAKVGDWLARIGDEYERLSAMPSMQAREPDSGGRGGLASQRSVGDLGVMSMRDRRSRERSDDDPDGNSVLGVFETLHAHAETVREGRNIGYPLAHIEPCKVPCMHLACWSGVAQEVRVPLTVTSERKLLAERVNFEWLLADDSAGQFYADIRQLWSLLKSSNAPEPRTARRQCACGGSIRWRDGAAECGSCGTRTTGLDVVRHQTEGAVA